MSYVNILSSIENTGGLMKTAKKLMLPKSTLGDWFTEAKPHRDDDTVNRYVITCAQNATEINEEFLATLHSYCKYHEAELIVIPFTYGNITKDNNWYDSRLEPFFLETQRVLNSNLRIMGHYHTNPTAINPLGGTTTKIITKSSSGIFPHPQIALISVPTPQNKLPKILTTTGAITIPNYTKTKAGYNGIFNHTFGAITVTIKDDSIFHMRHILANEEDGSFYDLDKLYMSDGKVKEKQTILAIATGDEHVDWIDENVVKATYKDDDCIINILKPAKIFRHDTLDFYSRNHHHRDNFLTNYAKHHNNVDEKPITDIVGELERCVQFINDTTPEYATSYIVQSNHNDALTRWLCESDFRLDPQNAVLFLELNLAMLNNVKMTDSGVSTISPFEYWARGKTNSVFLERDNSFRVADIEMSFHGDQGVNGARGSANSFAQIGTKSIIGHSHCHTEDHSILVKGRGWIPIKDIKQYDTVLCYDHNTNGNIYLTVDKKFKLSYTGTLITVGNQFWRQEVTDQHHMFLRDGSYIPIGQCITTRSCGEIPLTANPISSVTDMEYPISDIQLRRIIATCADGSFQGTSLRFYLKKKRKIERLNYLFEGQLRDWGNGYNGAQKVTVINKSITHKELIDLNLHISKKIPQFFYKLSNRQKEIVLEECALWDGSENNRSGRQYSSKLESDLQIISTIATELGYRCTYNQYSDRIIRYISWCCANRDYTFLNEGSHDKKRIQDWNVHTREVENENVYCIRTLNKNFWVRNNKTGQVSLSGNSPQINKGVYQVGTSSKLKLEYTHGPSSWLNTHCIIYANGKRTLINIIGGEWH